MLDYIEYKPQTTPKAIIIWLHGLGADYHDFYSIAEILQTPNFPIHWVFPNAPIQPVSINGGMSMRAWYDIRSPKLITDTDDNGIRKSILAILDLIEEQKNVYPDLPILMGGFSQGAVIAMMMAQMQSQAIQGIIALSGYLPKTDFEMPIHHVPCFLSHGMNDAIVPFKAGEFAMQTLKQYQHDVTWHYNDREHGVDMETLNEIKKWLTEFSNDNIKQG